MPELPLVGEEFAGYRLNAILGRGGMSVVYRAENPRLGNVIALKVLDPSLATDDIFRTRFLEESRIAASLNHPHVIPIHDMGSSAGLLYIAMRCVTGTDLRQMLKKRGRLQPDTSVFLLDQAGRALDAAHRSGLVHRDVKPGNLLVERGNDGSDPDHVYLADFGITKHLGGRTGLTSTGQFLGTIDYVAPEQIRGTSVLGYADQYSLGCVLYECLTGRVPFEKDLDAAIIWAHVEEAPTMPTVLRPDLPPAIDDVFARVLAKRPRDRFDNCKDFMAAARDALGHMAEPPGTGGVPSRFTPPSGPTPQGEPDAVAGYRLAEIAHETLDPHHAPPTNWAPLESTWDRPQSSAPPLTPPPLTPLPPTPPQDGPGRRRGPSRTLLAAIAAVIVAAACAVAVTLAVTRGNSPTGGSAAGATGSPTGSTASTTGSQASATPGMGMSSSSVTASPTTPPPTPNAITPANRIVYCSPSGAEATVAQDKGMSGPSALKSVLFLADLCSSPENSIPPQTCKWTNATLATCTAPYPGVASVTFETYPTLAALYSAYETEITQLNGSYTQNTKAICGTGAAGYTENGWNHENGHPINFTVAQMESASFKPVYAMGRQACFTAGKTPYLVWTSDDGKMLAVARGSSTASLLYDWWGNVHHVILFPRTEMCGQNMERMADAPQGNLITDPTCPTGVSGTGSGM